MRISWISKILNGFLTSKSSRHVWQASFKTIPENQRPPPRPSGITEMAYANLLYGQLCMVCVPVVNRIARPSNQRSQNCAIDGPLIAAWRALMRVCGPCVEKMYFFRFSSSPFGYSTIIPSAIDMRKTPTGDLNLSQMLEVLPTFWVKCGCIFPQFAIWWANRSADTNGGVAEKVLRSDSEGFSEELAAVGKSSRENVIEKWKSLVRERNEVGDCSVHCDSVSSVFLQFKNAMVEQEKLAEQAKEDARADIQKRRIERCVIVYLSVPREIHSCPIESGRGSLKKAGMKRS